MARGKRSANGGRISALRLYGKRALDYALPKKCALCGEVICVYDGGELCPPCLAAYSKRLAERCPVCRKDAASCACSRLRAKNLGAGVTALGFYKTSGDEIGRLVYSFKHDYSRDLTRFFARSLAARIMRSDGSRAKDALIAFPPRSPAARRKYGFDHARGLAKDTARFLGAAFCPALRRTKGGEQKALGAKEREENAADAFEVADKYADAIAGREVILVDDVATTGATLASAAKALRDAGASDVRFAVLFVAADKPQSERDGIWFEDSDAPDAESDSFDPLADDVGF